MSRHSFDPEIAKQVGVNAAVIYQNILWWAEKNAANGNHFYDGLWWTYNSVSAFAELFPYLTGKQIRTALDRLEQDGLLASGVYNKSAYDRTKWYAPTCPVGKHDLPSGANEIALKGEPIPVINTDHKPVNNILAQPECVSKEVWDDFLAIRKAKRAPLTKTALDAIEREAAKAGWTLNDALSESVARGWQGFKSDWVKETNNGKGNRTNSNAQRGSSGDGFTAVLREVGSRDDAFQASSNDGGMQQAPRIGFSPSGRD